MSAGGLAIYDGVMLGLPLLAIALALGQRRHWSRRARADAGVDGETVRGGVVEEPEGAAVVAVEIDERGFASRIHPHIQWDETARRVSARRFHLRTAAGERIEVSAEEKVLLIAPLETVACEGRARTRRAAIAPGDSVHLAGRLGHRAPGDPYRDDATGLTLSAPRGGRLVISTAPLRERFERNADYWTQKAQGIALLAATVHLLAGFAWRADLAQLGAPGAWLAGSNLAGVARWVLGVLCATLGSSSFFVERPWYEARRVRETERKPRAG